MDYSENIKVFRLAAKKLMKTQRRLFKHAESCDNYGRMAEIEAYGNGLDQMLVLFDHIFDPMNKRKGD